MTRASERRTAIELAQQKARGALLGESAPVGSVDLYACEWDVWTGAMRTERAPMRARPAPPSSPPTVRAAPWWRRLLARR